ncbi:DgaE family pyridoxal phosphate-dependent ammonia lyase [Ornithinibacillus bavariensis]|uniref:L-seryl-tRNA selenium transferase n=1 Tax=Ornithinibacillus bavariensis TaxID=545502 RepID=A0A919X9P8_9BACI|nr:DgaE family pyridoxal phosphate-dependent ammonia lyase [Ornithinibacillus bavariensis]GIO27090.1 L-seryl-tRNA selenium transferase [Ornithinibacillus bavariensis]
MSVSKLNLRRVVNASGKMSILGVSTLSDEVVEAIKEGAQRYYEMEELHHKAGQYIAEQLKTEGALITNSASSAIALAIAGLITKGDSYFVEHLYEINQSLHREVLIMMGHLINYGAPISTMIQLGGGEVKSVGYANGCTMNQIEAAITNRTVAIVYVQSHHTVQKSMPPLKEISSLAQKHNIPLIVDAAAETNIMVYSNYADLIIWSGSKALEGPTSGILAGKKNYVDFARMHNQGIGRAMKIGKESIFGLLQAIDQYNWQEISKEQQLERLSHFECLNDLNGITVSIHQDESKREIYRARILVDEKSVSTPATHIVQALKEGEIAIYTRDYHANNGYFEIDPRTIDDQDIPLIINKFKETLEARSPIITDEDFT